MLQGVLNNLPGWQSVLFVVLVIAFLLVGGIITIVILSRMRWPLSYVVLEDIAGRGFNITRKGKCRLIGFGNGGEEIVLLKHTNKLRVGYGKRIGTKQIGWAVGEDGLWYQFNFGDLNKTLRELGIMPVSVNVRLGMSSVRKGLDKRYEEGDWFDKYGKILEFGLLIIAICILTFAVVKNSKAQIETARINSEVVNTSLKVQEANQKTMSAIDEILSRINLNSNVIGGSGLVPNG